MIKVRVDWHHKCSGCGTELITDFFDESAGSQGCPWCGCADGMDERPDSALRDYLTEAVREIEQKANDVSLVKG